MANKISEMTAAGSLTGTELIEVSVPSGSPTTYATKSATIQDILAAASNPLGWFDVTTYGALGDNVTDDTAAIQAAIDACETAGGGTVYFPAGIYVVGGALQDTSRSNSQLLLPRRHYLDTKAIGITLRGEAPPGAIPSVIGATPLANTHSILRGTLNTASGTSPSMIGAWGPSGSVDNFTNILLQVVDLGVSMPANPALTACNFSHVAGIDLDNVLIEAGSMDVAGLSAQTTAASFGLMTPANNNGAYTRIGALNIIGFYNGTDVNEHCNGQQVSIWGCKAAVTFRAANHASHFVRLMTVHCQKGLVFVGGIHNTTINQYDIEHAASGAWVSTSDIDDASNYSRGFLRWHTVLAGTGADNTLVVSGAAYLTRNHPQTGIFVLTDGATITPDLTKADSFRVTLAGNRTLANPTSPFDGQTGNIQVIQDATGSRTLAYGTKWKFPGGAPVLSTAANSVDVISYIYDATSDTLRCAIVKALA